MSFPVRKNLKGRRAVVLGSGAAGLSAAISLAVRGAKVVVVEAGAEPGGELRGLEFDGISFPAWPPYWTSPTILAELFASASLRISDFLTLEQSANLARVYPAQGAAFEWPQGTDTLLAQLEGVSPEGTQGMATLINQGTRLTAALEKFDRAAFHSKLGALLSPSFVAEFKALLDPRNDAWRINASLGKSPLATLLRSMRTLNYQPPTKSHGLYLADLAEWIQHGGWEEAPGTVSVLKALLRVCELLEIRILTNAEVKQVELQNGRVRQVIGRGFKPIQASVLVSTLEPVNTLALLNPFPAEVRGQRMSLRKGRRPAPETFLTVAVAQKIWPKLPNFGIVLPEEAVEEARALDKWLLPPSSPGFCFITGKAPEEGQTAFLLRMEVPTRSLRYRWAPLQVDEEQIRLLDILEARGFKGLRESVIRQESCWPGGTSVPALQLYGMQNTPAPRRHLLDLLRMPLPRVRKVPGLYLAGEGIHPGLGNHRQILLGMAAAVAASEDAVG